MLVGFPLRRAVTVALCAGSFRLGLKADLPARPESAAAACPEAAHGG